MFFIYGTDAPIYHYPIVTSVMVVVNVAVHLLWTSTGIDILPFILAFGDGLHPLQWVTHNFLHAGWMHLIGNMIFLFPFGLIVEGKIGWARMLALYMAIGTFQGFTQQVIMLPSDPASEAQALVDLFNDPDNPMDEETRQELQAKWREELRPQDFGSLGASAVIFGLLAVCVIWAPVNEFNVYFRWSLLISAPDGGDREWSVATVCGIFVVKEFLMFLMMGMPISSEALHLNGFVVGGMFGLGMLYLGMVDCEGFDLISIWSGRKFKANRTKKREERERREALEAERPAGPPPAVVPRMPHQLSFQTSAGTDASVRILPSVSPSARGQKAAAQPAGDVQERGNEKPAFLDSERLPGAAPAPASETPIPPLMEGLELPDFDDGAAAVDPHQAARQQIESLIVQQRFTEAAQQLAQHRKADRDYVPPPVAIGKLAEGLIREKRDKAVVWLLNLGIQTYPLYAPRWQIRLASLELTHRNDPIAAIKQLKQVDKEMLDSKSRQQYLKLARRAQQVAQQRD